MAAGTTACGGSYTSQQILNAASNFTICWRVDLTTSTMYLGIQAKTTGYVSFGIPEASSTTMGGSDMVVASVSVAGSSVSARDYYATKTGSRPTEDVCNDWTALGGSEVSNVTTVHLKRALDTGDMYQDRPFSPGAMAVVYAWSRSNSDTFGGHGTSNRGIASVSFYGPKPISASSIPGTTSVLVTMGSATVSSATTTYLCKSIQMNNTNLGQVVAFRMNIQPSNLNYVHHALLHICTSKTSWYNQYSGAASSNQCDNAVGDPSTGCSQLYWAWAVGMPDFILPPQAGMVIGGPNVLMVLSIHYDNPSGSGFVDDSGVEMFVDYTNSRPYNASVITLGNPSANAEDIPANKTAFETEFMCGRDCLNTLPSDVTLFASFQHMHGYGSMIWSRYWGPNDEDLGVPNSCEYWNFKSEKTMATNQLLIKRGSRVNTHCVYNTASSNSPVSFGGSTANEMCMDFIYVYPEVSSLSSCGSNSNSTPSNGFCTPNPSFSQISATNSRDAKGFEIKKFGRSSDSRAFCPTFAPTAFPTTAPAPTAFPTTAYPTQINAITISTIFTMDISAWNDTYCQAYKAGLLAKLGSSATLGSCTARAGSVVASATYLNPPAGVSASNVATIVASASFSGALSGVSFTSPSATASVPSSACRLEVGITALVLLLSAFLTLGF
jgi:hypothetical protein